MTKIKEISTQRYEIALFENMMYYTIMVTQNGKATKSEKIVGVLTANHLFDLMLVELEGN